MREPCLIRPFGVEGRDLSSYNAGDLVDYINYITTEARLCANKIEIINEWYERETTPD